MKSAILRLAGVLPMLLALPAGATEALPADIADMSIEELANIQIHSVSKKPEALAGAAATVFVITADDIRRSGFTSLPEVLRLAPNLQVGKTSNGGYAISARGQGSVAHGATALDVQFGAGQGTRPGATQGGALSNSDVPGNTAFDARFGWRLRRGLELSLSGQNLNGGHGEYGPLATRMEVGRTLGMKLVWQR